MIATLAVTCWAHGQGAHCSRVHRVVCTRVHLTIFAEFETTVGVIIGNAPCYDGSRPLRLRNSRSAGENIQPVDHIVDHLNDDAAGVFFNCRLVDGSPYPFLDGAYASLGFRYVLIGCAGI